MTGPPSRALAERTRVGYVIGQLTRGGAERQLYELVRGLDRDRVEPVVYCLSGSTAPFGEKITAAGVKVTALPRNGRFELSRALDLARHARRDRIDILHAFLVHASGYAWVAKRLARVPRLITSARNCQPMGALQDRLISRVFRSSDAIVCNAEAVRTFVQRQYAAPRERCHVIHNGVDLARFSLASDVGHAPTVMTAGRLVAQKDLGLFLEAAALLIRECPATRFLIAGDGPARRDLVAMAARLRLTSAVSFLGERSDVPELLRAVDVFWLTSSWEGLPNVILEAQAAGVPVVTRDAGGVREIVHDGGTGYVVTSRDAQAFASHTRELLSSPEKARAMGLAGRRLVETRFSAATMVRSTERLYEAVLHRAPSELNA